MSVFRLDDRLVFPHPSHADEDGLLAVGGDLSPDRLLLAYVNGIFPWYEEGLPILWHSPDPRTVIQLPDGLHVPKSLRKAMRRVPPRYEIRSDTAFDRVIAACAETKRPGQRGTWITEEVKRAYGELHRLGWAHSAEAWAGGELVGGLYGVSIGSVFFGESMFARAEDASKIAFATLCEWMAGWGVTLVDCQVHTAHLERFGAVEWPRTKFLAAVKRGVKAPGRRGTWDLREA